MPGATRAPHPEPRRKLFACKPPTLMLGAIKTADQVVVKFDMELRTASPERGVHRTVPPSHPTRPAEALVQLRPPW